MALGLGVLVLDAMVLDTLVLDALVLDALVLQGVLEVDAELDVVDAVELVVMAGAPPVGPGMMTSTVWVAITTCGAGADVELPLTLTT